MFGRFLTSNTVTAKVYIDARPRCSLKPSGHLRQSPHCNSRKWSESKTTAFDQPKIRINGNRFQSNDGVGINVNCRVGK